MAVTNEVLAERIDNVAKTLAGVVQEFRETGKSASEDRRRIYEAQEDTNLQLLALKLRMDAIEPHTQALIIMREQAKGAAKLARALPGIAGGAFVAGFIYLFSKIPDLFK